MRCIHGVDGEGGSKRTSKRQKRRKRRCERLGHHSSWTGCPVRVPLGRADPNGEQRTDEQVDTRQAALFFGAFSGQESTRIAQHGWAVGKGGEPCAASGDVGVFCLGSAFIYSFLGPPGAWLYLLVFWGEESRSRARSTTWTVGAGGGGGWGELGRRSHNPRAPTEADPLFGPVGRGEWSGQLAARSWHLAGRQTEQTETKTWGASREQTPT